MDNYDELEERAIKNTKAKKSKMKVSGKSVFLLKKTSEESGYKTEDCLDNRA